jgi:hypothetical protein
MPGCRIRRLGGTRAREMRFRRLLHNSAVSVEAMAAHAVAATAERVAGLDIAVVQDTSEVVLGGRELRDDYGPVGRGGATRGYLLHAALAVEVGSGALLGVAGLDIWTRSGGKVKARRGQATAAKESRRWIETMAGQGALREKAARVTLVGDAESDIYELFARRPAGIDVLVRAAQNRKVKGSGEGPDRLFALVDSWPELGRATVELRAIPGRRARPAKLAVRASEVELCRPRHGADPSLPETLSLSVVELREVDAPVGQKPLRWRLLTSHRVTTVEEAQRTANLYRQRWVIEEFFRTLKSAGFELDQAEISQPKAMLNFAAACSLAAVTIMQLVQARDGKTAQPLAHAFDTADQPLIEALSTQLEGKTQRQKNPHPKGSLAFVAWVVGRLGGWTGYYGKPGPFVMAIGLGKLTAAKQGWLLASKNL